MQNRTTIFTIVGIIIIGLLGLVLSQTFSLSPEDRPKSDPSQSATVQGVAEVQKQPVIQNSDEIANPLQEEYAGWQDQLEPCPCTQVEATNSFTFVNATHLATAQKHPGAVSEYRTVGAIIEPYTPAMDRPALMPGQQCTYDEQGNLITGGAGAGTPDAYSPEVTTAGQAASINSHDYWDLRPLERGEMTWETYHETWTPNNGNACVENIVPALEQELTTKIDELKEKIPELTFGITATSTLAADDALWWFEGKAGQGVRIQMESLDQNFDPGFVLRDPSGIELGTYYPYKSIILPADGVYTIGTGTQYARILPTSDGQTIRYTLEISKFATSTLILGESIESDSSEERIWKIDGKVGQKLIIQLDNDDEDVDPQLNLRHPRSREYRTEGGYLLGANPRLETVIFETGIHSLVVSNIRKDTSYTLTLSEDNSSLLTPSKRVESTIEENSVWNLQGQMGDILDVAFEPLDRNASYGVTLYGPDGAVLAQRQTLGEEVIRIKLKLPLDGNYPLKIDARGGFSTEFPYRLRYGPTNEADIQLDKLIDALQAVPRGTEESVIQNQVDEIATLVSERTGPMEVEAAIQVCLLGVFYNRATVVAGDICTQAVEAANDLEIAENRQTIGIAYMANTLAQGSVGNKEGALNSLRAITELMGTSSSVTEEWTTRLEAGEDPTAIFNDETIGQFKQELGF